jgi:hypothetical protein
MEPSSNFTLSTAPASYPSLPDHNQTRASTTQPVAVVTVTVTVTALPSQPGHVKLAPLPPFSQPACRWLLIHPGNLTLR